MKQHIPWWGKILAKIVMSRLPAGYKTWQRLGLFRHGYMDQANYALDIFNSHVNRANLTSRLNGKMVLELGPGDSIASAIIAHAYGARAILVDTGKFAIEDFSLYIPLCEILHSQGLRSPDLTRTSSLNEILDTCNAKYLDNGIESLCMIPDQSIDFIFSQAVLEHIRKAEFLDTIRETARILKPCGVCSHRVDLKDHLGGGLNNLRFSERIWESGFFAKSGFYTNRIRFDEMLLLFSEAGFTSKIIHVDKWLNLPLPKKFMSIPFSRKQDNDLLVSGFNVILMDKDAEAIDNR